MNMTVCEPSFAGKNPILYVNMDNVLVGFQSGLILFGSERFPDWRSILFFLVALLRKSK